MSTISTTSTIHVDKCDPEFFYQKFKQAYPIFRNPRGLCLIVNIYQIDGMPPRRWSERDTDSLKQLFEQLMYAVEVYTDSTHDLTLHKLKNLLYEFSKRKEHKQAQSCVVCLMSHGEEGFLTSKEGEKIILDDIFNMFNNLNCPYLAGKPKLFFIQSCRDDPVCGPAEDLGVRVNVTRQQQTTQDPTHDETDGPGQPATTADANHHHHHMPSINDMLIGFPTQKGYIAYRKPEIGSWYMNAIVQTFSKHAKDTDLCAMLNMVNSLISNEVTNTGKKQMSEYTSKFTKPYFFFFPGIYVDDDMETAINEHHANMSMDEDAILLRLKQVASSGGPCSPNDKKRCVAKRLKRCHQGDDQQLSLSSSSSSLTTRVEKLNIKDILTHRHKMFIAHRARIHWKQIAREMAIDENDINEIDGTSDDRALSAKNQLDLDCSKQKQLYNILNIWIDKIGIANATTTQLMQILSACKLNSIKEDFCSKLDEFATYSIMDELNK